MRHLSNLAALALLALVGVSSLITGKYAARGPCEAARKAVSAEAPGILAELAKRDRDFALADQATRSFSGLRKAFEVYGRNAVAQGAARELAEAGPAECAVMVALRELNPQGFRRLAVDKFMEEAPPPAKRRAPR